MTYIDIIGYIAAAVLISMSLPQTITLIKTRNIEGVSFSTWAIMAGVLAIWAGYAIQINATPLLISSLLGFTTAAMPAVLVAAKTHNLGYTILGAILTGTILIVAATILPATLIGTIATITMIGSRIPQTITSIQHRIKNIPSSVPTLTWTLSTIGSGIWVIYGTLINDPPTIISNSVGVILSLTILLMVKTTQTQTAETETPQTLETV